MATVVLEKLEKSFSAGERPALSALDLEVQDGELMVVVGPSGCGKSTALRIIAGLEEPTGGRVLLGGRDLSGVPPQKRDVAMVFQGYALYPHLSVRENMAFPLKMRGMATAARAAKVAEIAALVGLGGKLERMPSQLSGGERQRVAMGRAIVREPQLFLFDEPLSNLDAKLRAELRVELAALVRRLGVTALYVTHDQAEAMTMADRVAVLRDGELQQIGTPRAVYEEPVNTFVAGFLGTPPMNLWELSCEDGTARAEGIAIALPEEMRRRKRVTVGFRPEHVRFEGTAIRAETIAHEPLGPETLVHLRSGERRLSARVAGFGGPDPGSPVTLGVSSEHLHWFDPETGARVTWGHPTPRVQGGPA